MSSEDSKKLGRPKGPKIEYSVEQLDTAIEMAARGESLKNIINAMLTNEVHFWKYRQDNPAFDKIFNSARQEGLEHLADALITMADEYQDVQRARLKSDNHKWLLSKRKPTVYGDKVDIHVSQTIDLSAAISDAKSRIVTDLTLDKISETKNPLAALMEGVSDSDSVSSEDE